MRCVVAYCENDGRHKFPKDEARRKQWIEAIKHLKKINITSSSVICSDHFQLSDFSVIPTYWNNYYTGRIINKSVVPSVFPWSKPAEVVKIPQPPPPIQDLLSFNPKQVKATYSRVLPTGRVEKKNNTVSTVTDNALRTNKKLRCLITDCENEGRHKFPEDEVRRKQWIKAIKCLKPRTNLTIRDHSLLCSDHFRLSVFPWENTSVEPSSIQVKLEQPSSSIQVQQPSSCIQVEQSSSSILYKQLSLPINVKLEQPSPSIQVKKLSSPIQVKKKSSSIRAKRLSSSIRVKQPSSTVQVKQPSPSVQVKLEPPLSPIQVQLEPTLSPIQVKLEPPSSPIKVKKSSSSKRVKKSSSSIRVKKSSSSKRVKKLSSAIRVKQPSSAIQVELELPLSPIQVKLEPPSSPIQVKLEPPSSPIQVKLEPPSSPIQVRQLSSPIQVKQLSAPIKVKQLSSPIKVRQSSSPIHDTRGFNRSGKVKATDPRVCLEQNSTETDDVKTKKKLRCVVADCENRGRHRFPKDEVRRRQWMDAIIHVKPGKVINDRSLICSDHFQTTDFSVTPSIWNNFFMPTVFVGEQNDMVSTEDPHEDPLLLSY